MPRYDYTCNTCRIRTEALCAYEDRLQGPACPHCGIAMEYQFPLSFTPSIFKPFYAEVFDCDVNSRREWNAILKEKGVVEAGDKVGGARNYEEKWNTLGPVAPKDVGNYWQRPKVEVPDNPIDNEAPPGTTVTAKDMGATVRTPQEILKDL